MAIALSTDPIEDATDKSVRWVDRFLMIVFVACVLGMIVYALIRLFS